MSEPEEQALAPIDLEWETDEAPEELRRLILFQACDEWFGLPIEWVREIQPLDPGPAPDPILVALGQEARHFGMAVEETIEER